ncbi:hypothetical protein [Methylobacterium sp. A54F]
MGPRFDNEWLDHQDELDVGFSEDFLLDPTAKPVASSGRVDVNAGSVSSASRSMMPFPGIFVAAGAMLHAHGRAMADSTTRAVASEQPMIDAPIAALTQRPQQGDRVHRSGTGEVFEVTRYLAESPVRAWIYLSERRTAQRPDR